MKVHVPDGSYNVSLLLIATASLLLLLFVFPSSLNLTYAASTPSFSAPVNLGSAITGAAQNPNIAASGSCVYVSYPQATAGHGTQVYVRSSSNNGLTFGAAVDVSQNMVGKHNFQRIWAIGTYAYMTWEDTLSGGTQNILFSYTSNCGSTWSKPVQLNSVIIPSNCPYLCAQPTITASGSDVYVTWTQQNPSQVSSGCGKTSKCEDIYFVAGTNNGANFGPNHYFGNTGYTGQAHEVEIASSGTSVYLTWDDKHLYFQVSHDSGATWFFSNTKSGQENAFVLSQNPAWPATNREPHISASGSSVYVIWESDYATSTTTGNEKAYVQVSSNSGNNWLVNSTGGLSPFVFGQNTWLPMVFASGTNAYATWGGIVKGSFQAFVTSSSNSGTSWSTPINLSNDAGPSHDTQVTASASLLYVMYFDNSSSLGGTGSHPMVVESTDGGSTFGSAVDLSKGAGATIEVQNDQPQIMISGSRVCATWLQTVGTVQDVMYSNATSP